MLDATLGHQLFGAGPRPVVVLNDWLCDTTTWDAARPYLDVDHFTWAFADLRGYGLSRGRHGDFTVREMAADVLALADVRGWSTFAVVGHSMSTLAALHLAQHHADRVEATVLITPPPPAGFGAPDAYVESTRALVLGEPAARAAWMIDRAGDRLSAGWARHKAERWLATSDPVAVAGYVAAFAQKGLPDAHTRVKGPVLAITGEQDAPPMRSVAIHQALAPLCDALTVVSIAESGHYPMQETPPLLVAHVERFLGAVRARGSGS